MKKSILALAAVALIGLSGSVLADESTEVGAKIYERAFGRGCGTCHDIASNPQLFELVKAGKLDPVIGRDDEIKRILQILSRRTKNNPLIIGESGCVDGDTIITIRKISNDTTHENIEIDY